MAESTDWKPGADVAELLEPLAGPPAARLTDGFSAVEAEIGKITNPSGQPVDWQGVVKTESAAYLKKTAKDLRIATYLGVAWIQEGSPAGLRRGLDLLTGMLEQCWDQIYPPIEKLKSRANALTWYTEHALPDVEKALAKKLPDDEGKVLVEKFMQYRAVVTRRFEKRPPLTTPLVEAFEAAQKAGRLPVPKKEEAKAAEAQGEGEQHPILQPFDGDPPEGPDPKLTDEFDLVFNEIQKLEALESDSGPDWKQIRELSLKILTTKGKELRCAVYWTWARLQLEGIDGFRDSLAIVGKFCERFENFHPKRPKARAAALRWIGARMDEGLKDKLKTIKEDDATALHRSLDAMEKALGGRASSLEGIQRARSAVMSLRVIKNKPPPPKAPPKPKAPTPAAVPTPAAPPPVAVAPAAPPGGAIPDNVKEIVDQMLDVAQQAAAGGETAVSLRIRRQAVWMVPPPLLQGRKYACNGLNLMEKGPPENLFRSKSWPELLAYTEQAIVSYPFFFEMTYWAAMAAKELIGPEAEQGLAAEAVSLAIREPKLLYGTDGRGIGLATDQVRKWIEGHRGSAGATAATPGPAAPAPAAGGAGAAPAPDGKAPAKVAASPETLPPDIEQLFTDGKINEAVRKAAPGASGLMGRAAFQRNLLLAERLTKANSHRVAFSYFRALLGQLRNGSLIEWEPTVGARCIRGYLQCAGATSTRIEDERALIDELMILDPGAAIGLF